MSVLGGEFAFTVHLCLSKMEIGNKGEIDLQVCKVNQNQILINDMYLLAALSINWSKVVKYHKRTAEYFFSL